MSSNIRSVQPSPSYDPAAETTRPSRARYWVIVFAVTLSIITYIDRVCISQAAPDMSRDLGLSKEQMGLAFSAFALSYALFEIPGGWAGDWIGPRKVLMRVVVMWSMFTAATGWAWNLVSLWIARFIFGAGEAGCFPNLTKAFTIWLPKGERVRAQGIMWMSARWGGAFTPLLVVWVFSFLSWRDAFVLFGAIGMVWAIFFFRWFRDDPREHPSVNAAELALLEEGGRDATGHSKIPWEKFVTSRTVWMLWGQYFCMSYGWYFYITWLPTYLRETRGLQLDQNAFMAWLRELLHSFFSPETTQKVMVAALAGIPLFFGGLGSIFTGLISARIARMLASTARTRRAMAFIGLAGAAAMLLLSAQIKDPLLAMLSMGLASFSNDLAMPGAWGACMDVGGRYAGSLSGSMNMMGNLAGFVAPNAIPFILGHTDNNWAVTFWISAAIYFCGALCWLFIDPVTPMDPKMTIGQNMKFADVVLAFQGRICRSTFWVRGWLPITVFLGLAHLALYAFISGKLWLPFESSLAVLLGVFYATVAVLGGRAALAILVKRCHDRDRSGWWLFLALIPVIGQIWLVIDIIIQKGTEGDNRFGSDPLTAC